MLDKILLFLKNPGFTVLSFPFGVIVKIPQKTWLGRVNGNQCPFRFELKDIT